MNRGPVHHGLPWTTHFKTDYSRKKKLLVYGRWTMVIKLSSIRWKNHKPWYTTEFLLFLENANIFCVLSIKEANRELAHANQSLVYWVGSLELKLSCMARLLPSVWRRVVINSLISSWSFDVIACIIYSVRDRYWQRAGLNFCYFAAIGSLYFCICIINQYIFFRDHILLLYFSICLFDIAI